MIESATLQWVGADAAILRLHEHADARYGDDFVWSIVVAVRPGGVAELLAADRPLPSGGARVVCDALRAAGFTRRTHERRSTRGIRTVTKEL